MSKECISLEFLGNKFLRTIQRIHTLEFDKLQGDDDEEKYRKFYKLLIFLLLMFRKDLRVLFLVELGLWRLEKIIFGLEVSRGQEVDVMIKDFVSSDIFG